MKMNILMILWNWCKTLCETVGSLLANVQQKKSHSNLVSLSGRTINGNTLLLLKFPFNPSEVYSVVLFEAEMGCCESMCVIIKLH